MAEQLAKCTGCNGSGNYDDTERSIRETTCDHKFVDSEHCLKCGWTPCPECKGLGFKRGGTP